MIRWMLGLSLAFATVLGVLMIKGNQDVTAGFFWFAATTAGLVIALGVVLRFRGAGHSLGWKLQRISGAFLLVMVPAHLLFMHLNLPMGHEAEVVIARMQSLFVRVVDVLLLGSVLFHGGYGLASVLGDYVGFKPLRWGLAVLVSVGVVLLAWMGIRVILLV
jgi:succinate dehydrogenase hydrophobic membrane anchor protein